MHPKITCLASFLLRITCLCQLYLESVLLLAKNTYLISMDEKPGIRLSTRIVADTPIKPGQLRRQDVGYVRHGTADLFAAKLIATGQLIHYSVTTSHTEVDTLTFFEQTAQKLPPTACLIFTLDQAATHKSESLVRWIAKHIDYQQPLGVKNRAGILKNKISRQMFLEDTSHRIRFCFTPVHCSWINPIENWFGKLQRHALKYAAFPDQKALAQRIDGYVAYYNQTLAKPFWWRKNPERILKVFSA